MEDTKTRVCACNCGCDYKLPSEYADDEIICGACLNNCYEQNNIMDYFINCKDENIVAFANSLMYQVGETLKADETAKDKVCELAGDTSVEQVWENKNYVAMLSTDSAITVLNIVDKRDERQMVSVEVD